MRDYRNATRPATTATSRRSPNEAASSAPRGCSPTSTRTTPTSSTGETGWRRSWSGSWPSHDRRTAARRGNCTATSASTRAGTRGAPLSQRAGRSPIRSSTCQGQPRDAASLPQRRRRSDRSGRDLAVRGRARGRRAGDVDGLAAIDGGGTRGTMGCRHASVRHGALARACPRARAARALDERDEVARRVRAAIHASGLDRATFAERIGTSTSRLSSYATGRVAPSPTLLVRMERLSAAGTGQQDET